MASSMPFEYMANSLEEAHFVIICLSAKSLEVLNSMKKSEECKWH